MRMTEPKSEDQSLGGLRSAGFLEALDRGGHGRLLQLRVLRLGLFDEQRKAPQAGSCIVTSDDSGRTAGYLLRIELPSPSA